MIKTNIMLDFIFEIVVHFIFEILFKAVLTYPGALIIWIITSRKKGFEETLKQNKSESVFVSIFFWALLITPLIIFL
jgi:hypothetical protein